MTGPGGDGPRTPFALAGRRAEDGSGDAGHSAARRTAGLARVALVPFVALGGAVAGLVFLVLLPICGIGTVAEAAARGAWAFVREACAHARGHAERQSGSGQA